MLRDAAIRHLPDPVDKTVLVVDDDVNQRNLVAQILSKEGVTIREASGGREALEIMEEWMPDLLILDLLMPEVDGFSVLRALRANRQAVKLPVLVLTGAALSSAERAYLTAGLASTISKREASLEYLSAIVKDALTSTENSGRQSPTG